MALAVESLQIRRIDDRRERLQRDHLNILNPDHRWEAFDHLKTGGILLIECFGPIGFMFRTERDGNPKAAQAIAEMVAGIKSRSAAEKAFPVYIPKKQIAEVADFRTMAALVDCKPEVYERAMIEAMVTTGSIFQLALKAEETKNFPYPMIVETRLGKIHTIVATCIEGVYPALGKLVRDVWEDEGITNITSANVHNEPTLTDMLGATRRYGNEPGILVIDNPDLREAMRNSRLEAASYSLALMMTKIEEGLLTLPFSRRGWADPGWIAEVVTKVLGEAVVAGATEKNLVANPFMDGDNHQKILGSMSWQRGFEDE